MPALGYRRRRVLPGVRTTRRFSSTSRRRRDRTSAYTKVKAEEARGAGPQRCPRCSTPTRRSAATPRRSTTGMVYVRLVAEAVRAGAASESKLDVARASSCGLAASPRASATDRSTTPSRSSCSCRDPDSRELNRLADVDRGRVPQGARRGGRRPLDARPEAGTRDRGRSRTRRLAGRHGRRQSRRRCASAFAGVDAGDWVDPTGKTRDVYRAAVARRRGRACRTSRRCRCSCPDPMDRASPVPLGQVARHPHRRSGPRASITQSRARHLGPGEHAGRALNEVVEGHRGAAADRRTAAAGYVITQGGQSEDQKRGVRPAFSPRSASRSC